MSFKSSLNALFKLSGGMAMPNVSDSTKTTYSFENVNEQEIVAPSDGCACVRFVVETDVQDCRLYVNHVRFSANTSSKTGDWLNAWALAKKGDTIGIQTTRNTVLTSAQIDFYKLVGEGFLRFINGLLNPFKEVQYA